MYRFIILGISLLLFSFLLLTGPAFGQRSQYLLEKVQQEVEILHTELELDSIQSKKVGKIMNVYIQELKKISEGIDRDWASSKHVFLEIENVKDDELYETLTEEQWIIYNVLKDKLYVRWPKKSKGRNS